MGGAGAWRRLQSEGGRLRKAAECSGMPPEVAAKQRERGGMERNAAALRCRNRQASSRRHAEAPPMLPLTLEVLL